MELATLVAAITPPLLTLLTRMTLMTLLPIRVQSGQSRRVSREPVKGRTGLCEGGVTGMAGAG